MKMNYDALNQPYASNRYCVTAKNGMVATGNALASSAGLSILQKGGNAVDAAVATAAALTVVEPTANGIGSDAFAIVWINNELHGINGSGYSPKHMTLNRVKPLVDNKELPKHGWLPVMVPGAPKTWARLIERFGNLSLEEVLQPAMEYAENGFPLSPSIASSWQKAVEKYKELFKDKLEYREFFKTFTKDNEPYAFGDIVKLENHAKTLRLIAQTNGDAFYKGEIADQFIKQSLRDGGFFCKEDLASYDVEWVDPISVNYRGYDIFELPPNGQGITALMALNILKEFQFEERETGDTYHKQLEAMKIAFADSKHYVSDPTTMKMDYKRFLTDEYGAMRAKEITDMAFEPRFCIPPKSGTVYLCTADKFGNMVSMIQSNYMGFGSGVVLEGYGVSLQNRGCEFSLDEDDVNVLAPHKRSYHTIIPGFMMKDGKAIGPFGVMGGYMQPQGHVQVVMNMIDFNLNPQMALDAPRWQWIEKRKVEVEKTVSQEIFDDLYDRGHDISYSENTSSFGRGQIIQRLENGTLVGACESRTDSNIACY